MTTISTVNLNGIRAASRRGLGEWLAREAPTALLLQEVRADEATTVGLLGPAWDAVVVPSRVKGRAGVAVAVDRTRASLDHDSVRDHLDSAETDADSGRWVEATVDLGTPVRLVSAYFHSGEVGSPRQEAKMAHLPRIGARLRELREQSVGGTPVVVGGDFNIVRTRQDIRNWSSNHNKRAGVLDDEIAYLQTWVSHGWHDVTRELAGDVQGPYTWWSWRGKAYDNDAGWRLDHEFVTEDLARRATGFRIDRAPTWDARFSDHAPLSVDYDL